MTRASVVTMLTPDRFAKIMGVNPIHFSGATAAVWPVSGSCESIWPQHPWQTTEEIISREELARAIFDAESEIARVLGYSPAPVWIEAEPHPYIYPLISPSYHAPQSVDTFYRKVIAGGRKSTTLVQSGVSVTYSDEDGDGYKERATITVATTVTEAKQLHVFFAGMSGHPAWEVRFPHTITISGGTATILLDTHLLIDPDLWEKTPYSHSTIDLDLDSSVVDTVDIYRIYNDTTQPSVVFVLRNTCTWCGGGGCSACTLETANGCLVMRDAEAGAAIPHSATYSSEDGEWQSTPLYGVLNRFDLWYYAGDLALEYVAGRSYDPLSDYWAHAIAWFATARLGRPFCNCSNLRQVEEDLRRDMTKRVTGLAYTIDLTGDLLRNPFGTRVGEFRAWQRVTNLSSGRAMDAVPI